MHGSNLNCKALAKKPNGKHPVYMDPTLYSLLGWAPCSTGYAVHLFWITMLCTRSILTYVRFGILWVYPGISPSILSSAWEALLKGEKLAVQRLLLEKIHFTMKKLTDWEKMICSIDHKQQLNAANDITWREEILKYILRTTWKDVLKIRDLRDISLLAENISNIRKSRDLILKTANFVHLTWMICFWHKGI